MVILRGPLSALRQPARICFLEKETVNYQHTGSIMQLCGARQRLHNLWHPDPYQCVIQSLQNLGDENMRQSIATHVRLRIHDELLPRKVAPQWRERRPDTDSTTNSGPGAAIMFGSGTPHGMSKSRWVQVASCARKHRCPPPCLKATSCWRHDRVESDQPHHVLGSIAGDDMIQTCQSNWQGQYWLPPFG